MTTKRKATETAEFPLRLSRPYCLVPIRSSRFVVAFVFVVVVALLSLSASASDSESDDIATSDEGAGTVHSTVQILTERTFDDALSDAANGLWFLKFYAPWCGHCKKMAPMLLKVAPFVKGKMAIGKIDCTVEKKLCKRFGVRGYPTLKFFRDGEFYDYPGGRDADAIIEFAEKMSSEAVTPVSSYEEAMESIASKHPDGVAFVAYDPAASVGNASSGDTTKKLETTAAEEALQTTATLQVFRQVARKAQAAASFGLIMPGSAMVDEEYAKFGAEPGKPFVAKIERGVDSLVYAGEMTSPNLYKFVDENNVALVTKLGPHNFRALGDKGRPLAVGAVDYDDAAKTDRLIADMTTYAKTGPADVRSRYRFCHMDGKKWAGFLRQFEVDPSNLPDFFILDVPKKKYWRDEESTFGVENIHDFIGAVASGSIKAKDQQDTVGLSPYQKFNVLFVRWMPWSVLAMMVFFVGVLYVLTLLCLPDDEELGQPAMRKPESSDKAETGEKKESKKEK